VKGKMVVAELLEENDEKLIEIMAILNSPNSPTRNLATIYNVVEVVEELLELYVEAQGKVDEIQDMVGRGW
jgi:hypothetical protein